MTFSSLGGSEDVYLDMVTRLARSTRCFLYGCKEVEDFPDMPFYYIDDDCVTEIPIQDISVNGA